jgi:hypothetical protein
VPLSTKDKILFGSIAFLVFVCIASITWAIVLNNRIRTDPNKDRVSELAARIIDLESELQSGRNSLDDAIREGIEAKRLAREIGAELDGYKKRLDVGAGAIGRGEDGVGRIESVLEQIEARGTMGTN